MCPAPCLVEALLQAWGSAVRGLLQALIFWPWRGGSPCLPVAFGGGGGAFLGFTVLFLWLGGLLFLLYIPPSRTIYWKPICKVFTHSVPLDWCYSVAVRHGSPQINNK